jgi:hypothetical protein
MRRLLGSHDDTRPWTGPYVSYDLVKGLCIALGVVTSLAVLLAVLFSSPDEQPSTIEQWSRRMPVNFLMAATKELDDESLTAEYGPPYNHNGEGQHAAFLDPQKWLGVDQPIDTAEDYVIGPLRTLSSDLALQRGIAEYKEASAYLQSDGTNSYEKALRKASVAGDGSVSVRPGEYENVDTIMHGLLGLAQSGGLESDLLNSHQSFQTDYTKPLLLMADGELLEERANEQHLLAKQWGMMNETGSYPGQAWLWLYTFWYQIEPFKSSPNADILVILVTTLLSLAFVCIPFIPGIRSIPRLIPVHRLIWREHYRAQSTPLHELSQAS